MQPIVFLLFLSGWQSLCTQFTVGKLQSAESTNKREREKKKTSEWGEPQNKQKKPFKVQNACSLCHCGNYVILFCILALMLFPVVLSKQTGVWRKSL